MTRERMDFRTDLLPVDVLGLFCPRTAKSGGESKLVSALTLHNVLREGGIPVKSTEAAR